ncbi:MAG: hypothetical protein ACTSWY_00180 [Promethearchaeota archaeon]
MGYDIHKKARPEVAESGGFVFLLGIIPAFIIIFIFYPQIRNESIVFLITALFSGFIGFIDDRVMLSSLKKIVLTVLIGIPIFILNYFGFIIIESPVIPILGQLQLTIIYPLVIPIIILILTNTVNMLEGYNGEGSGTCLIAIFFLLICSIIAQSSEGLIYSLAIIGALVAFVEFNKFPAKVFPGDVGTLALGASIACIAIFGSLEVAMFCVILVHVFNSFYVLSSLKGFKESHTIKIKDIILSKNDIILPSRGKDAPLTLPRLILSEKPMNEPELVKNLWSLAYVGGLFALIAEVFKQWTLGNYDIIWIFLILIIAAIGCIPIIIKFPAIRVIIYLMISILIFGMVLLIIIDLFIVQNIWNWLITGIIVGASLILWYYVSIRYFWYKMSLLEENNKKP